MRLRLIRHATLVLSAGGKTLLVDPMLDAAGTRPPIPDTPSPRANPLVELPEPAEKIVEGIDAVLVTHRHEDHLDDDVLAVARHAPDVHVVAVHLEAINHCLETRADLHRGLHDRGLQGRVTVPEDGSFVPV